MAELIAKQMQLQRMIDRSLDNFKKIGRNNLTPAKIRSRMAALKEIWLLMLNGHAALAKAIPEASQSSMEYFSSNLIDQAGDVYQTTLDYMSECVEELEPPVSANSTTYVDNNHPNAAGFSLSHLPPIRLPPFDGKYEEWEPFRDRFTALIINNKDLNNFGKMHFLTSCLKGRALDVIGNIPVTADNFDIAWRTLINRFENKRRLLNLHLSTLLHLPVVSRESATELQMLRDKVLVSVASLEHLQRSPEDLWNDVLVHIIVQKLDSSTRKAWNVRSSDDDEPPTFAALLRFLDSRARALEEFHAPFAGKSPGKSATVARVTVATASSTVAENLTPCPICKAKHYFSACPIFVNGAIERRRELAKRHRRCYNCLSSNHSAGDCKSKYSCRQCKQRHHSMLHAVSSSDTSTSLASPTICQSSQADDTKGEISALIASRNKHAGNTVLLATAWITVGLSSGRAVVVRALIDQGSEMTFISENLSQLLRAKRRKMPISVSAIGGVLAGTVRYATQINISPHNSSSPSLTTEALIMKNLTSYTPIRVIDFPSLPHLSNLQWADPNPASSDPINIILGADIYNDIILEGLRKGDVGEPIAQQTIFGWVISGPVPTGNSSRGFSKATASLSAVSVAVHHCLSTPSLESVIQRFWELEEVPKKSALTPDEEQCEEHFCMTHSRSDSGRYIVRLPFKTGPPIDIGESRCRAKKSLESLARRLSGRPKLAAEYNEFLSEYEQLEHMRKVPALPESGEQHVYIPHHPVFREASTTTRLRVVFNASSVSSNGSSLNDHLLAGPKLQTELAAVVLKWRQFRYVYAADIAKMFRQVRLDDRDINYQRILWKTKPNIAPEEFQLLTVTYGMACAPFLALRVLKQLASDEGSNYPLANSILHENIYVDDILFGGDNIEILLQTRDQLISLLGRGGFELRKWVSNSPTLLSDIDTAKHGLACSKLLQADENLKILGIAWTPALDQFHIALSLAEDAPQSKRSILSTIARLYDPLGWITPVTITAKIFMQQLWKKNLKWDDPLPENLLSRWRSIYNKLPHLNNLRIARWTGLGSEACRAELHGFADASNSAYSAVMYLKVVSKTGEVTITLIAGKSRVAPLNPTSIPRLELCAAVLLARLIDFVRGSCNWAHLLCYCWSDSTVVLAWLDQHPSRWKTFVAHRVAEVHALLPTVAWRHVPTEQNPADCASRGLFGDELLVHSLWWRGPPWLRHSEAAWPSTTFNLPVDASLEEKLVVLTTTTPRATCDLVSRFSSWTKLIRVTAYIFRFILRCRRGKSDSLSTDPPGLALTALECSDAKKFWFKYIQAEVFPTELLALSRNRSLSSKTSLLSLRPFLDQDGLLRVGGRLRQAPIPYNSRHPLLLAAHPLVSLLIDYTHQRSLHAGLQLTLSTLRTEYWLLRARSLVKSRIYRCVVCVRERAVVPSQLMGDLPAVRVTASTRSFIHCGVDYAGPILIRASPGRGIKTKKSYIALFICLSTRAVHLELVGDYTTSAFLNAYVRFCSRRGLPRSIYSDNGTTFVGADRELTRAYRAALRDPDLQNRIASDNVSWHFIPPSAPHFGGLWEAGVKSVKHHLRRVLGVHCLTFEEFTTLLCRVEACLNSRPTAPLSDHLDDYEALTPGHFLIGSAISVNPEPSLLSHRENRLTRWQLVRQLTERFWKLWQTDYLNTLQQRCKWRTVQPQLKIGQLVLLRNPAIPPCKWELGRITQCHPGLDGLTRVVTVKTANSEYKRPIVKLCVLPVDCETPM